MTEEVYTAREYLEAFEPGVIGLMLDPEGSLEGDTKRAFRLAANLNFLPKLKGNYIAFSEKVWHLVYP